MAFELYMDKSKFIKGARALALLLGLSNFAEAASAKPWVLWTGNDYTQYIRSADLELIGEESEIAKDPKLAPLSKHPHVSQKLATPLRWYRLNIENKTQLDFHLKLVSTEPSTHRLILLSPSSSDPNGMGREMLSDRSTYPDSMQRLTMVSLHLRPGQQYFYIGLSSYFQQTEIKLTYPELQTQQDSQKTLITGLLLGCILMVSLASSLLYTLSQEKTFLIYGIYAGSLLPFFTVISGLSGHFLPALASHWLENHLSSLILLLLLGLNEFSRSFFAIDASRKKTNLYLKAQTALACLFLCFGFLLSSDLMLIPVVQAIGFIVIFSLCGIAIQLDRMKQYSARYYLFALGCFLAAGLVNLAWSLAIPIELDAIIMLMSGALLQLTLLPVSIRERLKIFHEAFSLKDKEIHEAKALIQILTHDISGPLFVIQSLSELNETRQQDAKVKQSFEKIRQAAISAQSILKTVKELEAIEAGKIDLLLKPVPILQVIQTSLNILEEKIKTKELNIQVTNRLKGEESKLYVLGEKTILEHTILQNLIYNAIKFSRKGDKIEIFLETDSFDQIRVRIFDHGVGIPRDMLPRIFSHSSNTSRKGTAGEKGTGLGLPLAYRYLKRFGGNLEVYSQSEDEYPQDHWTEITVKLKKAS